MEVLILSKTEYGSSHYCIGGITLTNKTFVRLLQQNGDYQPSSTALNIGDVWDIDYTYSENIREPHNEDVFVNSKAFVRKIPNLKTFIKNFGIPIWEGSANTLFEGRLRWTSNGSGFLSEKQYMLPSQSVGFWIPENDLFYTDGYYYVENKRLNYKGAESPKSKIPKGSLIRVSLAKWWCPDDFYEARCYLQLSGVYVDEIPKVEISTKIEKEKLIRIDEKEVKNRNYIPPKSTSDILADSTVIKKLHDNYIQSRGEEPKKIDKQSYYKFYLGWIKSLSKEDVDRIDWQIQKWTLEEVYESNGQKLNENEWQSILNHNEHLKGKNKSGGCYIATLCYENYYANQVCDLRDFRDYTLQKSNLGKYFIEIYYHYSPSLANALVGHKKINNLIRSIILDPLLWLIKLFGLNK